MKLSELASLIEKDIPKQALDTDITIIINGYERHIKDIEYCHDCHIYHLVVGEIK